jgi:hypothetical protein
MAGRPVRQPYAGVDFIPQSGIYEFGYWIRIGIKVESQIRIGIKTMQMHITAASATINSFNK